MQPQSRGTAVLQLAKSHFRALLEGERSVKNRAEMRFYRTGVKAEDEVPSPPVLQRCISARFLLRAPKSALSAISLAAELRSHGSVAAFLQLRAPSNERCDAAHFHSGWLCTAFRRVWGVL